RSRRGLVFATASSVAAAVACMVATCVALPLIGAWHAGFASRLFRPVIVAVSFLAGFAIGAWAAVLPLLVVLLQFSPTILVMRVEGEASFETSTGGLVMCGALLLGLAEAGVVAGAVLAM